MQLHGARGILPFESSAQRFCRAKLFTFLLDTHKNSVRGEYISMEATCLAFGFPVWEVAEKFLHLHFHETNLSTPICTYFPSPGILGRLLIIQDVVSVLCLWTANIGFS